MRISMFPVAQMLPPLAIFARVLVVVALLAGGGCWRQPGPHVVVYTALDNEFSEPVLKRFQREHAIEIPAVYDAESTKTVGLYNRIRAERARPRCDVFWNNEILHTILLEREGLLQPYEKAAQRSVRDGYRSSTGSWVGIAARARVLIINTDKLPDPANRPNRFVDLADDRWAGQAAYARPFFGTTKTHFLTLFQKWGDPSSNDFFRKLHKNAVMVDGNKQVAQAVARGQVAFGITDTDDAIVEIENGAPVAIVFPDQAEDDIGTLFIPNTIAMIRDAPNPTEARQLIDFLVSEETERQLAEGASAQFPVLGGSTKSRVAPDEPLKWMEVDFEKVADAAEKAMEVLTDIFGE